MGINYEIYNRAIDIINARRIAAKAENDRRFEEVNRKIPEIAEVNSQLAKTGLEIVNVIRSGEDVSQRIESMKAKNLQAQELIRKLLRDNGYPEDYLQIKYKCEKCFDTGFTGGGQCECLKSTISALSVREMNRNSQIKLCSFDTFDISYFRGKTPEETTACRDVMSRIFSYCKSYAESFSTESKNILMFGKTGLGKTHLSLAIANQVIQKGYDVLYDSAVNYLMQIEKEHFGRDDSGRDTLQSLLTADLLILDDLGAEYDTPFYTSTIYNIINTRLNRSLPTIISTNLNHEGIQKKYDDRIVSRLFAIYQCLEFVGTDIRLIKRKMGEG